MLGLAERDRPRGKGRPVLGLTDRDGVNGCWRHADPFVIRLRGTRAVCEEATVDLDAVCRVARTVGAVLREAHEFDQTIVPHTFTHTVFLTARPLPSITQQGDEPRYATTMRPRLPVREDRDDGRPSRIEHACHHGKDRRIGEQRDARDDECRDDHHQCHIDGLFLLARS